MYSFILLAVIKLNEKQLFVVDGDEDDMIISEVFSHRCSGV